MKQVLKLSSLSDDPHLREMIVGSAIGMSVKVLSAVSILFMNIVVARFLGANETGLFFSCLYSGYHHRSSGATRS